MTTMTAVRLHSDEGPDGLTVDTVPAPTPGAGEALVQVHAAALTRDELTWPVDRLPAIPSYELSGVVVGVGAGVDAALVGQAVLGLTPFDRDGVAAEMAVVPAHLLARRPPGVDDVHAAAIPLPGLTAWQALFDHGGMDKEQRVLVLGAAGGVGQLAVQIAALHGAYVVGTASPSGSDLARRLGAREVLDPADADGMAALAPVDLVLDTVGGAIVERAARRVQPGGRLVSVAADPPTLADSTVTSTYFVVEPNSVQLAELARLAATGDLQVVVDSIYRLAAARAAFERVQSAGKRGKVVLQVRDA